MELKHKLGLVFAYLALYHIVQWFHGKPEGYVGSTPSRKDGQGSIDIFTEEGKFAGRKRHDPKKKHTGGKRDMSKGREWMSDIPPNVQNDL